MPASSREAVRRDLQALVDSGTVSLNVTDNSVDNRDA